MAAEAASLPSLEAQHQEEYIDYSEDESAVPALATKGPNHSSFSANSHYAAEAPETTGAVPMGLEHQTIDLEVEAEAVYVTVGDQAEGNSLEPVAAPDNENTDLIDLNAEGPVDASYNENELSWEDGPGDELDADQGDGYVSLHKEDWQLIDEEAHITEDSNIPVDDVEDVAEREEMHSFASDQATHDPSNTFEDISANAEDTGPIFDSALEGEQATEIENIDTNTQETGPGVDPALEKEQAAKIQISEADNDLHELDYYEEGIQPADVLLETEVTSERQEADYENLDNAPTNQDTEDQDAEDHAMGENDELQSQYETESNVAAANGDGTNDQENGNGVADASDYPATGDDKSEAEHVEFDDEVLADVRSVSADSPSKEDMEIPVITVSYKGVDYPFFYGSADSEGKECFFNDLSLLHCKMEGVLAGFRRELANELGPFDELVFQVDELGLEFAESSQSEMFSDITLGQIISVFDSLVKNQDPDASKPLYAFLVTRPNCKKRWLSLVDDAYNGKSLDEISYYFASQAPSEVPEIMDDEPGLIGEEDNADAAAWPHSPGESEQGDQNDDDQSHAGTAELHEDDDVGDGINGEDDAQSRDAAGEIAFKSTVNPLEVLDVETTIVDTEVSLMDESTAVADIDTVDGTDLADSMEDQQPPQFGENAPEIGISNPLANWDVDEADLLNAVGDVQNLPVHEDPVTVVDQHVEGANDNSANKVTPNTSATSTLNGDEEVTYENELDLDAEIPGNEEFNGEVTGQDELAEIDWREFPGQGDDDVAESPSVSGKRPRSDVDDLLDDEAQKDVKRRRS